MPLPSPGWLLFTVFLILEILLALILVMPMPSNDFRGTLLQVAVKAYTNKKVHVGSWIMVAVCALYFYDAASSLWVAPVWTFSCEQREMLFFVERNLYATGFSIVLFLILRRLLDIQTQLYMMRSQAKAHMKPSDGKPPADGLILDKPSDKLE